MSSLRVASRETTSTTDDIEVAEWVPVTSPLRSQKQPCAPGVVLSLASARERYRAGAESSITIDDIPEFGSGDAELAHAIAESVDANWDR